jgi:uncharacterized protein (DUF2062 family)
MIESAVFGAAVGIFLALDPFNVLILLPATLLVVSAAVPLGSHSLVTIILNPLCAVASLEISYVLVGVVWKYLPTRVGANSAELVRTVRTAVGRELNTHFQLPGDVPPEMAAMLAKLG